MRDLQRNKSSANQPQVGRALSEGQCLLLSRFADGECSMLGGFLVKLLRRINPAAESFLNELADTKDSCQELALRELSSRDINLWERIDKRIDQEIKSQAFLGKREDRYRTERVSSLLFRELSLFKSSANLVSGAIGGVAGAAVAALLIITFGAPSRRDIGNIIPTSANYRAPKILSSNHQQPQTILPRPLRITPRIRASSDQRLINAANAGWQLVVPSDSGRGTQRLRVVRRLGVVEGNLVEASRSRRGANTVVLLIPPSGR
jgi:hypothetical protein